MMYGPQWLYRPIQPSDNFVDEDKTDINNPAERPYNYLQSIIDRLTGPSFCLLVLGVFFGGLLLGGIGGSSIKRFDHSDAAYSNADPIEQVEESSNAATQLHTMVKAFRTLRTTNAMEKYNLTDNGLFQRPLGSRLLLLNVDNRTPEFSHNLPGHGYEWGRSNIFLYGQYTN